jgi:hypothetical protein
MGDRFAIILVFIKECTTRVVGYKVPITLRHHIFPEFDLIVTIARNEGLANNYRGAWTARKDGELNKEEESSVGAGEEEKVAGEEDGALEERRKRPLERSEVLRRSTPEDRPNKHSRVIVVIM